MRTQSPWIEILATVKEGQSVFVGDGHNGGSLLIWWGGRWEVLDFDDLEWKSADAIAVVADYDFDRFGTPPSLGADLDDGIFLVDVEDLDRLESGTVLWRSDQ